MLANPAAAGAALTLQEKEHVLAMPSSETAESPALNERIQRM